MCVYIPCGWRTELQEENPRTHGWQLINRFICCQLALLLVFCLGKLVACASPFPVDEYHKILTVSPFVSILLVLFPMEIRLAHETWCWLDSSTCLTLMAACSLFGRPYRIVDYLLLAGLVREKNIVPGWKFTIVYEQANRLLIFPCSTCPVTSRILFEKLMPCAFRFLVDDYMHD